MKKVFLVLSFCLALGVTGSSHEFITVSSMVPADADLYGRTARIDHLLRFLTPFAINHLGLPQRKALFKDIHRYLDQAGIDPFSVSSLDEHGIDVRRPAAYAEFSRFPGKKRAMIALPVTNPGRILEVFGKLVVIVNGNSSFPVIRHYRGAKLYQSANGLIFTVMSGYLVVSNGMLLIKEMVNLHADGQGSLARQPLFGKWSSMVKPDSIVSIYSPEGHDSFIHQEMTVAGNTFNHTIYSVTPRNPECFRKVPHGNRLYTKREGVQEGFWGYSLPMVSSVPFITPGAGTLLESYTGIEPGQVVSRGLSSWQVISRVPGNAILVTFAHNKETRSWLVKAITEHYRNQKGNVKSTRTLLRASTNDTWCRMELKGDTLILVAGKGEMKREFAHIMKLEVSELQGRALSAGMCRGEGMAGYLSALGMDNRIVQGIVPTAQECTVFSTCHRQGMVTRFIITMKGTVH